MRIAYFGRPGSYSHQIATRRFSKGAEFLPCPTHSQVVDAVLSKKASIGLLPFENSAAGVVMETIDTLVSQEFVHSHFRIREHVDLAPDLALLSNVPLKKIKRLYSHPFPLRYLSLWIEKNLPGVELFETVSTSEAAHLANERARAAAIAGPHAAKIYDLDILRGKLANPREYITRFCIISAKPLPRQPKPTHMACSFGLKHQPGALVHALSIFARHGLNLTRIISRPLAYRTGKFEPDAYLFWVDVDIRVNPASLKSSLQELHKATTFLDILGQYHLS